MSEDETKETEYVTADTTDSISQNLLRLWCSKNEVIKLQCHQKLKESTGSACGSKKEGRTFCGFVTCPLPHSLGLLSSSNASNNCSKLGKQGGKIGIFVKNKQVNGKLVQTGSKEKLNIQHNLSTSQLLQHYREKVIYTRSRLVKAQKQATMITNEGKHRSQRKEKPSSKKSSVESSPRKVPSNHPSPKNNITNKKTKPKSKKKKRSIHKSSPDIKKARSSPTYKKQAKKQRPIRLPIIMNVVNVEGQQLTDSSDVITQVFQKKTLSLKNKLNLSLTNTSCNKKYGNFDQVNANKLQQKTLYSKINSKKIKLIPAIQCNTYSPEVLSDKLKTTYYQEHLEENKFPQKLQTVRPYNIHLNTPRATDDKSENKSQVQPKYFINETFDDTSIMMKTEIYPVNEYAIDDLSNNLKKDVPDLKIWHMDERVHLPKIKSAEKNNMHSRDISLEESGNLFNYSENDTSIPIRQLMPTIDAFCAKINKQKGKYTIGLNPMKPIEHPTQSSLSQISDSEDIEQINSDPKAKFFKLMDITKRETINANILSSALATDSKKEIEVKNEIDKYRNNLTSEMYKVAEEIKQKRINLFPSTTKNLNSQNICTNNSFITKGNSLTPLTHLSNTSKIMSENNKYLVESMEIKKNPSMITPATLNPCMSNVIQGLTESRNLTGNSLRLKYRTHSINKVEPKSSDKNFNNKTIFTLSKTHTNTPNAPPTSGNDEATSDEKITLPGKSNLEENNDIDKQIKSNVSTTEIIQKLTDSGKFRASVPILKDEISNINKTELKNAERKIHFPSIFLKNNIITEDNIQSSIMKSSELLKKNLNTRLQKPLIMKSKKSNEHTSLPLKMKESRTIRHENVGTESLSENQKPLIMKSSNSNEDSSLSLKIEESRSIRHENVGTESISENKKAESSPIYQSEYLKFVLTKSSGATDNHKTANMANKNVSMPKMEIQASEMASKDLELGVYAKGAKNSFNFKSDKAVEHVQGLMKKIQETESRLQALHEIRTTMDHPQDINIIKDSTLKIL